MKNLNIAVVNNKATYIQRDGFIVCGNSSYTVTFAFDSEWDEYSIKIARFKWNGVVHDVVIQDNVVDVPKITNATQVEVGVYSGDLAVTTPAIIPCVKSILCEDGMPADPSPDVYAQIISMLESLKVGSGISISETKINSAGELVIYYSDGTSKNVGKVVGSNGQDGASGKDGNDGISITNAKIDTDGNLIFYFSNGNTVNVGKVGEGGTTTPETPETGDQNTTIHETNGSRGLQYNVYVDYAECSGIGDCTDDDIVIGSVVDGLPVTDITRGAFGSRVGITGVTIPNSVESIGDCAFAGCTNLLSVTIPGSVSVIGVGAFESCIYLENATFEEGVTYIASSMFAFCDSLEIVNIPKSVTRIDNYAFDSCGYLTDVYYAGSENEWKEIVIGDGNYSLTQATIHCAGKDSQSSGLEYTLNKDGLSYAVTGIGGCTDTEIIIPSTYNGLPVTGIHFDAFRRCTSITSVTIPDTVKNIAMQAFSDCRSLTSITIPNSVIVIGSSAFSGSGLTSVIISNGVVSINSDTFRGTNLTSVIIPDGVTFIGANAFQGCSSLTSITIPVTVTKIAYDAFAYCSNLKNVSYGGTQEQWNEITIGSGNEYLTKAYGG